MEHAILGTGVVLDVVAAGSEISVPPTLQYGLGGGSLIVVAILLGLLVYYDTLNVGVDPGQSNRRAHLNELVTVILPLLILFASYVLFASLQVLE